jgi:hypothetical protein
LVIIRVLREKKDKFERYDGLFKSVSDKWDGGDEKSGCIVSASNNFRKPYPHKLARSLKFVEENKMV